MPRQNKMLWKVAVVLLTVVVVLGCRQVNRPANRAELAGMVYPRDAPYGKDRKIYAVPERHMIVLINATARPYDEVYLWLNQSYVAAVTRLDIGTGNRISLARFINHYGESYPVGGFLHPDKRFPVVAAELFDPATGQRHRLCVPVVERRPGPVSDGAIVQ